jgi:hypothetical protein
MDAATAGITADKAVMLDAIVLQCTRLLYKQTYKTYELHVRAMYCFY